MKLPGITRIRQKEAMAKEFDITIHVRAASDKEAAEMQIAIQDFVSHFNLAELKSGAKTLRNPVNRKLLKAIL